MDEIARTPEPPYWAVIFTSRLHASAEGYDETAERMVELARDQPGFLGFETARSDVGISVSYWDSEESIRAWKQNAEHLEAQLRGRTSWYETHVVRVCRVERAYWSAVPSPERDEGLSHGLPQRVNPSSDPM